ncbi:DUF4397 domain-containing protein [Mucilaginibacter polytrichastri]|uniref:DUF4397 domain-containing protein n=1 Tax=Mucilaginibacter polytrichastri TaxID=1302689 RepID=A0A1Q5ZTC9_9SPHI|nr:DUF4397 domain-containing protein [Mucilaginibacter polytrichastri]OKS85024.1 hypothetical protein RG47T_0462 [Mucilaginibacter polytrichastri]SFS45834.1 protein of unknown function [Mucilaginibacter polytrichastri]
MANKSKYIYNTLMLLLVAVIVVPLMASCGKSSDGTVNGYNSQLTVANLSPDIGPVDLYINNNIQNGLTPYRYPTLGAYFYMNTVGYPIQIRSDTGNKSILSTGILNPDKKTFKLMVTDSTVNRNAKYTLFVTGVKADGKLNFLFLVDTSKLSGVGRGKVRFINASPRSGAFDVYANQTSLCANIALNAYSPFVEMPVGDYDFKIYATGDFSTVLGEVKQTVGDGKLYTIYTYGIVGRTDSAAFNTGIIINK